MLNAVAADAWVATARRGACLFTGRDAVREVPMKVLFVDTVCIFYIWYLEYWNYICILECSEIHGRALHTSYRSGLDMVTAHRLIQNEPPGRGEFEVSTREWTEGAAQNHGLHRIVLIHTRGISNKP